MKLKRILQKKLRAGYHWERAVKDEVLRELISSPRRMNGDVHVASLIVGCVKIDATLYDIYPNKPLLAYDVFVKDSPDSTSWICYASPTDEARATEAEMLSVLDRIVRECGLSYTNSCFEKIEGIEVCIKAKPS